MLRESPSRKPEVGDCMELASPFFGPAGPEMIQTNNKNTVKRHIYIKILSRYTMIGFIITECYSNTLLHTS